MGSKVFSAAEKLDILEAIEENLITQRVITISDELINSLLKSDALQSARVSLFNKYYSSSLSRNKLNDRLSSLGNSFEHLVNDRDTIKLLDTEENNLFYSLLYRRILVKKKKKMAT